uniref:SAM domain-containing protein n=1 Tax=Knipowitschia caucasica TaxID=637954 RepID=A0AAV2KX51_KNICA
MKHQSISRWLSQLGLPQYCTALEQEYDGVEDLLHVSEYDLLELGVHSHLHRLHLLTSLLLIKERERRRVSPCCSPDPPPEARGSVVAEVNLYLEYSVTVLWYYLSVWKPATLSLTQRPDMFS